MTRALAMALVITFASATVAAAAETAVPLTASAEDLAWWREARFGLFIHWGPVSLKGTEIGWSRGRQVPVEEYDNLYKQFNPTKFDADAWVRTAKRAGMKYLVLTSKHHDGFCLWPSEVTDYDIAATPFKRDILAELSEACKREAIVFSVYHSICDWHHPDYPMGSPGGKTAKPNPNMDRYVQYMHAQLREIVTRYYGERGVLWFDGEWEKPWNAEYAHETVRLLRGLKPDLLINNRVGKGRHGMAGTTGKAAVPGDFDTPEQQVGRFQNQRPWESCITICRQWAWKPDDNMKSLAECVQTLVRCAGGDGNLLLNVGPMPDGRIEPRQVKRLEEIGDWLRARGESIYGTRGGPFKPGPYGASTRKGNRIYLHVFQWQDGAARLPAIGPKVTGASVLGGGKAEVTQIDEGLTIRVPEADRSDIDTVVVLDLDGSAMGVEPVAWVSGSVAAGKKATASNVYQKDAAHYGPAMAVDDDPGTRWATDAGTRKVHLEVDLGKPTRIGRVTIDECTRYGGGRVRTFRLEAETNGAWRTVLEGGKIGRHFTRTFDPVTARRVRLSILEASDGPTIWEFQLFAP